MSTRVEFVLETRRGQNMDSHPTDGDSAFPQTSTSMVAHLGGPERQQAMERFFRLYWSPFYIYLRRTGSPPQDALDLVQDFVVECIETPLLSRFVPARGRFRSFLLTCLKNMRKEARRRRHARPADRALAIVSTDAIEAQIADASATDPEQAFESDWAKRFLAESLDATEERLGKGMDKLAPRIFREWVVAHERPRAEVYAAELGLTVEYLHVRANRVRKAIRADLRARVAELAGDPAEIDSEVRDILRLAASRPRSRAARHRPLRSRK